MNYEQSIWIGGNFYGGFVRSSMVIHAERQPPRSLAYFCPHCGEIWARAEIEGCTQWEIGGGYCKEHPGPSPFTVPGSLLLAWEPEYCELLLSCPDVVRWEMTRHLEFIERRICNED